MCKVLMIAGIKPETSEKVWKFARTISKPMSKFNTDGIGYAAITADGSLFGERWLNNKHAFQRKVGLNDQLLAEMLGDAIEGHKETFEYNSFGEVDQSTAVALTLHTRMATSPKGLMNTHPFVQEGTSLIHNGVIRNTQDFEFSLSTCDSEAILISYLNNQVIDDVNNFQKVAQDLNGYYACGILTNTEEGPILDVFKTTARLYVAYVKQLETWVISTDDDDIKETCKELSYDMGSIFTILPNKFIRINALTGKEKSISKFEPRTETYHHQHSQNYPPTWTPSTSGTSHQKKETYTTPSSAATTKGADILPYGKHKENTKVSEELMTYFRSGPRECTRLSEREIQEEIMKQEKLYGSSRW